jgi:hypothetical protein
MKRKEQTLPQPLRLTLTYDKWVKQQAKRMKLSRARLLEQIVTQYIGGQYEQTSKETS